MFKFSPLFIPSPANNLSKTRSEALVDEFSKPLEASQDA